MRRHSFALLATTALALALPAIAVADAPTFRPCAGPPSKADERAAKDLYNLGKTAYEEGDYAHAIRYWSDAFDKDCTATKLLLNLDNAYERSGNLDGAIASLETYLRRNPNDDGAETIQKRIENLRSTRARTTAPTPTPTPTPVSSAPPLTTTSVGPSSADTVTRKGPGIAPWVVTGVGGALAITGVVFYLSGSSKISDARNACSATAADGSRVCGAGVDATSVQTESSTGHHDQTAGGIMIGVGLAGVVGGVLWGVLGASHGSSSSSSWLMPEVDRTFAGVRAAGRF